MILLSDVGRAAPVLQALVGDVVVSLHPTPKCVVMMPQIVEMAEAGSGIDILSSAGHET